MKNVLLLTLLSTVCSLAVMGPAHAEKADSEKEAVITAQRGQVDDVKQVRTVRAGKDGCIAVPQVADVGNLHPFINLKPMA